MSEALTELTAGRDLDTEINEARTAVLGSAAWRLEPPFGDLSGDDAEKAAVKEINEASPLAQWAFWTLEREHPTRRDRLPKTYDDPRASLHDEVYRRASRASVLIPGPPGWNEDDEDENTIIDLRSDGSPVLLHTGGSPDRGKASYGTPDLPVEWSTVTVTRPGEDPIVAQVGRNQKIIRQLLEESELSEDEARGLARGKPSKEEKERRDRLAVVVHRLREQHGCRLEAIADVLGCHKSTAMRLSRDGKRLLNARLA